MYFTNNVCKFKRIRILFPSNYFGEIALSLDNLRPATILADQDLELAVLSKSTF